MVSILIKWENSQGPIHHFNKHKKFKMTQNLIATTFNRQNIDISYKNWGFTREEFDKKV